MTTKQALNRIHWRLTSKTWKAKEEDVKAFNTLYEYFEKTNKKQLENNLIFAKMYIYLYMQILRKWNATVFDKQPKQEIFDIMSKPINHLIEEFKDELNDSERYQYMDEVGIETKHPATKSEEQKQNELKDVDINRLVNDVWDYETVEDNLNLQINNLLNYFNKQ